MNEQPEFKSGLLFLISLVLGFVVEAWPRGSTHVQRLSNAQAWDKANFFSQISFWFFQPIIDLAAKQQMLRPTDIVNTLPEDHKAQPSYIRLSTCWNTRLQWYQDKVHQLESSNISGEIKKKVKPPSLLTTILIANWRRLVPIVIVRIILPFTAYAAPLLLGLLLDYIGDGPDHDIRSSNQREDKLLGTAPSHSLLSLSLPGRNVEEKPLLYGLILASLMVVERVVMMGLYSICLKDNLLLSTEVKSALVAMIYRKALRLSPDARRKSSTGAITNHMSVDARTWGDGIELLSAWISIPFDIGICLFLLYRLLGWSFLAGVFTILALIPLQLWRGSVYEGLEEERLQTTDERVRLTSEVLSNSKIVKLYGWESAFRHKVLGARAKELNVLRRMGVLEAIMSVVFASSSAVISLMTFGVYMAIGHGTLTPKVVFVSISLFKLIHEPINRLAEGTSDTISLIVSTKRIQRFLLREEIDETQVTRESREGINNTGIAIQLKNVDLSWTSGKHTVLEEGVEEDEGSDENQPLLPQDQNHGATDGSNNDQPFKLTLRNINLTAMDKTLTAVVGRVGQGKSSLLSGMIGEMYKLQGSITIRGRVAYVPQQAWIINATLRDNIVFGNAYDPERYHEVICACGLELDLAVLPAGDMTEIGERGINLSGGQKQRVSLARATYDNADVYLLDDPLSAVDAHVDQHLWNNLIGPTGMLRDKTRILVTHGIHHLENVDQIVVIKDGEITELGKYSDLMAAGGSFYQLINGYSAKRKRVKKRGSSNRAAVESADATSATAATTKCIELVQANDNTTVGDLVDNSGLDWDNITMEDDEGEVSQEDDESKKQTAATATAIGKDQEDEADELIAEEVMKKGGVEWKLVKTYVKACTLQVVLAIIFICVAAEACQVGFSLWLKYWTSKSDEELQGSLVLFLGVYFAMALVFVALYIHFVYLSLAVARIRASELIHQNLISTVIRLPMNFFDTTPLGRVLNRFSGDLYSIDENLPWKFVDLLYLSTTVAATFMVIGFTTPAFIIMIPIIAAFFILISRRFLWATRSLKRIWSVSFSPIYQHFDESLNGVSTIRAMAIQKQFIEESDQLTDHNANAFSAYMYCNRWVDFRLQILSAGISFSVALSGVLARYTVDPSAIGLSLNFALGAAENIMWLCRDYTEWQSHLVGVERVQEYTDKYTEAPEHTDKSIPDQWPDKGRIVFKNYSTRYREGLDLVIKNLSFEIQPQEKVGIVGRTGAGKSSLTLALFRIIEAANSHWARASDNTGYHIRSLEPESEQQTLLRGRSEPNLPHSGHYDDDVDDDGNQNQSEEMDGGSIEIDGVDISTLGLVDLRKHLAIIPQDPTLFAGTIRDNLDPFQEASDQSLWEALERAHLKDHIRSLPGGLSAEVIQNGENFSVGQRSMICLARALLRKSKILVLDEATAAVDVETDELIQKTIREEFKDRTVLTIAHRIKTVMDSTKVLVMEKGEVIEYDTPERLLQRPESLFFKLAHQAGEITTLTQK
ncbi:hypothetical protein BX616_004444 [Lobosporangium transversale]|nr:hypothetical protein BX616_004444 [Lobosporangium transversale]